MKHLLILIASLVFVTRAMSITHNTIIFNNDVKQLICDGSESYFFSKIDLPIQTVSSQKFKPKDSINLQYITGWVWVKFTIRNKSENDRFVLTASSGHVSGFYLYKPTPQGYNITPEKVHHPEDGREIYNRLPSFFIDLKQGETQTFYMKIRAEQEVLHFSFILRDEVRFIEYSQGDYLILGLYLGSLLIIIVINIFYYISLKDQLFLVYAIYVFGSFMATSIFDGFSWLLISDTDLAYHLSFFGLRFWTDSLLFFTIQLVNLKETNKVFSRIAYAFICYHTVILGFLQLINAFDMRYKLIGEWELFNCLIAIAMVFAIIVISYKNNKFLFKYYLAAFGALLLSAAVLPLYGLANFENYLFFQHGIKAGTVIEMITLSFAVSRRFKITEDDLKIRKEEEQQLNEKVNQLEINVRKAQMNPHFIFNALSSIEYFILKNNREQARTYLSKFAQLMRLTLDNSRNNYISLTDELNALKLYIELEFLRLAPVQHTYEITVGEGIDADIIHIPALLIQPFVENAIWHGLQKKIAPGKLLIDINLHENELRCTVEDDGGGIERRAVPINRKTSGIQITKERLTLIHGILHSTYKFNILDIKKESGETMGTCVYLNMPFILEY